MYEGSPCSQIGMQGWYACSGLACRRHVGGTCGASDFLSCHLETLVFADKTFFHQLNRLSARTRRPGESAACPHRLMLSLDVRPPILNRQE